MKGIVDRLRIAAGLDEAVVPQPRQVLGKRRLAHANQLAEIPDAALAARKVAENEKTPLIAHGSQESAGAIRGFFNPIVSHG